MALIANPGVGTGRSNPCSPRASAPSARRQERGSGEIEQRLFDLAGDRLALMDETGLDVEVLSLTTPALHDLGRESVDLARRANDAVAQATTRWPDRFQALAALPVALPDEAALELERCVRTFGFKGAMLCGRVGDRNLDHPDLRPIFESAATLGVPILLHPRTPAPAIRSAYYSGFTPEVDAAFAMYSLGWHYDAGIQVIRLVLAGTFDRSPAGKANSAAHCSSPSSLRRAIPALLQQRAGRYDACPLSNRHYQQNVQAHLPTAASCKRWCVGNG